MEVILKDDVKGLGFKNDIIEVKPGYGRNYLIPQGIAIMADKTNKKVVAENIRQASHKAEKVKLDAQAIADQIGDQPFELRAKVGESGKIFGAVTTTQLSEALRAQGIEVDRKKISFDSEVKAAGEYTASIALHKEVKHTVHFNVVPE